MHLGARPFLLKSAVVGQLMAQPGLHLDASLSLRTCNLVIDAFRARASRLAAGLRAKVRSEAGLRAAAASFLRSGSSVFQERWRMGETWDVSRVRPNLSFEPTLCNAGPRSAPAHHAHRGPASHSAAQLKR